MTTAHTFLALGLYAAKDEEILRFYLGTLERGDEAAKQICETEMYYRGMGTRRIVGGFMLFEGEQKQLDEMRASLPAKPSPMTGQH